MGLIKGKRNIMPVVIIQLQFIVPLRIAHYR